MPLGTSGKYSIAKTKRAAQAGVFVQRKRDRSYKRLGSGSFEGGDLASYKLCSEASQQTLTFE
jgi:hypothetical protein